MGLKSGCPLKSLGKRVTIPTTVSHPDCNSGHSIAGISNLCLYRTPGDSEVASP